MATPDNELTDDGKLLFAAGFAFGVFVTLTILAVVLVTVTNVAGSAFGSAVVATLAGGVVFTAIVGAGLYFLAFPANRTRVAVDPELFGLESDEE